MERRTRLLLFANVGLWVAATLRVVQGRGEWDPGKMPLGWDLAVFRVASRMWNAHTPLYDFAEQARVHAELYGVGRDAYPFAYPPLLAIYATPLASVPHGVAFALVTASSALALWLVTRKLGVHPREALWVTASFPGFYALLAGQLAFVSLGIFALGYLLLRANRALLAGLALSLLAFKPQLLVAVPLVFLLDRKRAIGLLGLACGLLVQLGVCVTFAHDDTRAFPHALATFAEHAADKFKGSLSFTWRSFFGLLPVPHGPATILAVGAMAACAGLFLRWLWTARADLERTFALAVLATLACAWHCAPYDWVLLALPAMLLLPRVQTTSLARLVLVAAVVASWLVVPFIDAQERSFGVALHPAMPMLVAFSAWLARTPAKT
jgi:hypothetical protein